MSRSKRRPPGGQGQLQQPPSGSIFDYAALRAGEDPAYLGWCVRRYQAAERVSPAMLAAQLGGRVESLSRLSLCLRPRPESFAADVRAIARYHSIDEAALARIIRLSEALATMQTSGGDATKGLLLAARAREARDELSTPEMPATDKNKRGATSPGRRRRGRKHPPEDRGENG